MMKLSDDRIITLVKQTNLPSDSYVTTCGEKIYQTDHTTKTVTCYTIKGDKLWKFKDESVLTDPRGVTVDNDGNVYVTSCNSNSAVVIEPDGRQGRQIINSNVGLKDPIGIYFDKYKNSLMVVNFSGPCFLYQTC